MANVRATGPRRPGPSDQQRRPPVPGNTYLQEISKDLATLFLAAASSEVCRLCLSPVYGSIAKPSIAFPEPPIWEYFLIYLVWLSFVNFSKQTLQFLVKVLPIVGCGAPVITLYLFRFSSRLGPKWGPLLSAMLSTLPLLYISLLTVVYNLTRNQKTDLTHGARGNVGVLTIMILWVIFFSLRWIASIVFSNIIAFSSSNSWLLSRYAMQNVIICCYLVLKPSRLTLFGLPLICLAFFNEHMPGQAGIDMLNHGLQSQGYTVIARQESLTGYISVIDNIKDGFRVMRCDHSLLGGEWINRPAGYSSLLNEPIYAIFVLLEAVRLIKSLEQGPESVQTAEAQQEALFIGLGIGTSQAAFVAHGVQTTTIEIDPVVRDFATRYFDLPLNHTTIVADALSATKDIRNSTRRFDYIIHDVFTGGSEPIELFTLEFISDLSNLLKDGGKVAINYAGDLLLPSTASVVQTIFAVFTSCRLFREMRRQSEAGLEDYTNMVIFCRKSRKPVEFREPMEADFLGSQARKEHLWPQFEIDPRIFHGGEVIKRDTTWKLRESQKKSALGHWQVMRTVLPDVVWEHW